MVFALSVPVFAAQGDFVESPGKTNPTVTDVQTDIPDYNGKIVIVPYEKKSTLPSQESQLMDQAYNDIADGQNNSNLGDVLGQNTGVYDLFDIHENGSFSYNNGKYTITLAVGDVPNYKSIIYMDEDGTWHT
ncbi:MAG: hypothetical protein J5766_04330, partial [Clostridia bacterium]|nr:hypothetical protein [Clostridia bacterium]